MPRTWSFGRKIAAGFLSIALFAVVTSVVGIAAMEVVRATSEEVVSVYAARMLEVAEMRVARERRAKHVRSFLLSGDERYLGEMREARDELLGRLKAMGELSLSQPERERLDRITAANSAMQRAWDEAIEMRRQGASIAAILPHFDKSGAEVRALDERMNAMFSFEAELLANKQAEATQASSRATQALGGAGLLASVSALGLAVLLARGLRGLVGPALERLKAASAELQDDAQKQAASAKELAATTTEIATTMRELSATSRQMAASAKETARAAEDAGGSAHRGDETVKRAGRAIADIKRQVERIVGHMLDLGRRSQQIGGILEVINELAEQTNILAINATIEAAGAGEAGKRFSLVAMEIRRLADRVGGAAREIRVLIERINEAAGTTVVATESGSKAAQEGAAQFDEVLAAFEAIGSSVAVASTVAMEIELGVSQQVGAVDQASAALSEVATAARESEKHARATLDTSERLAEVSVELASLISSRAAA